MRALPGAALVEPAKQLQFFVENEAVVFHAAIVALVS